jgi:3-methyladenine DNA glycosylase AlkD
MTNEQLFASISQLEEAFNKHINPENGLAMSKYMKGRFPFYGIKAIERKLLQKEWFKSLPPDLSNEDRRNVIKELWLKENRELHYVAIDWMNGWNKKFISSEDKDLLKWLITNNSWWDSVDSIASNYLGKYIAKYPDVGFELIEEWRNDKNMWLNRSCLIFQLKYGASSDFDLMKSLIRQYQPAKEFFIQKAIGWSLRQYSKFRPEHVREFVHEIQLKGLALKEASKYL